MSNLRKSRSFIAALLLVAALAIISTAQAPIRAVERGSRTAKDGFRNEDEIAAKLNNWKSDPDAQKWLAGMGYDVTSVKNVTTAKPHGEKSDIEVRIMTPAGESVEGISIKLVSSATGFNQIDKRWLAHYSSMWKMPPLVRESLKLFVGETPPIRPGRSTVRMFLNEFERDRQQAVIDFFLQRKSEIVSDLLKGDGPHAARWMLVASKATANIRWTLTPIEKVISFYSDGPVTISSGGNLRIGRITMQRKGGDGGRQTAKMLQFKINPALLIGN